MHILKSLIYGFISGVAEFLPISSQGHQALYNQLFGEDIASPVMNLVVRLSLLAALIFCCWSTMMRFRLNTETRAIVKRKRNFTNRTYYDMQLIRNASLPLALVITLCMLVYRAENHPIFLAVCFLINGVILYIPSRLIRANKDSRMMTGFDSILIGIAGVLSVFPGISRIACTTSMATLRGANLKESYNWSLMISIPALAVLAVFDALKISGSAGSVGFIGYALSAVGAFGGGILSISLMRSLTFKSEISGFAYYAWGSAMLSLILYMIV